MIYKSIRILEKFICTPFGLGSHRCATIMYVTMLNAPTKKRQCLYACNNVGTTNMMKRGGIAARCGHLVKFMSTVHFFREVVANETKWIIVKTWFFYHILCKTTLDAEKLGSAQIYCLVPFLISFIISNKFKNSSNPILMANTP